MAPGDRRDGSTECRGTSRRRFLRTLGVLGGALAAVGTGVASAAPAGVAAAQRLRRSTAVLRLRQAPKLQQLAPGGPRIEVQLPQTSTLGEPPLPSTRQRLLNALFLEPGGGLRAADFNLAANANGVWQRSEPLTQVMNTDPLAAAFAEGVTLTPEGCRHASGTAWEGAAPMSYGSFQSWVNPEHFGRELWLGTVDQPFPGAFLSIMFTTPGQPQSSLTYAVELSMEPFDHGFECFVSSYPAGAAYESAAVTFVPTNDGTQMALIAIRGGGSSDSLCHGLHFRRGGASVGMTRFNWLNIVAL